MWPNGVYLLDFFCSNIRFYVLVSPYICFISFLWLDLYVLGDDALDKLGVFHAKQTSMSLYLHLY